MNPPSKGQPFRRKGWRAPYGRCGATGSLRPPLGRTLRGLPSPGHAPAAHRLPSRHRPSCLPPRPRPARRHRGEGPRFAPSEGRGTCLPSTQWRPRKQPRESRSFVTCSQRTTSAGQPRGRARASAVVAASSALSVVMGRPTPAEAETLLHPALRVVNGPGNRRPLCAAALATSASTRRCRSGEGCE
jgi:hypothetical protein